MEAAGVNSFGSSGPLQARISTTPLMATHSVPSRDLFPVPVWRPRSGRDAAYVRWERAKKMLLNAFGVTRGELSKGAIAGLVGAHGSVVAAGAATRAVAREQQGAVSELSAFQAINTAIFWHLILLAVGASQPA